METITEDKLQFTFSDNWTPAKLDGWTFYQGGTGKRNGFKDCCLGNKSVDIAALERSSNTLWLIEIKDYRLHRRSKPQPIWDEIAIKVRDSLASLLAASKNAHGEEKSKASDFVCAKNIRVVLHLEQPTSHSKLFPRIFKLADVTARLKQIIKPIDPHPLVVDKSSMPKNLWSVNQQ